MLSSACGGLNFIHSAALQHPGIKLPRKVDWSRIGLSWYLASMNDNAASEILRSFHRACVLVLGDVMLDRFIYGAVERISPEAPVPVMSIERSLDMLGGAANVARNVATLGGKAILIGVVGEDAPADDLMAQLRLVPTIRAHLIRDTSRRTTVKTRHVVDRQQILRTDVEDTVPLSEAVAREVLTPFLAELEQADIVVVSDYAKGVLTDPVVATAISAARNAGKLVLVDPKATSYRKYRGATILTPNRQELQMACGRECASDEQVVAGAADLLSQDICEAFVVTRGKSGISIIPRKGAPTHLRAAAREIFDVSGAGDTAVATLALGLSSGADLVTAANLANLAAGIVVGKPGTASVTAGEVNARLVQAEEEHPASKYFSLGGVQQLVSRWRELNLRIAFTNGCFDLLHPGHLALLKQARGCADRLVVGLNSDLSVRRLKGPGRPAQGEVARATVLASLKTVDAVVIFEDDTPLELITALRPDVLVKGADYTLQAVVGADQVQSWGGKVILADLVPAHSTSSTIQRIAAFDRA
jgi:D-beta-D-heptose 7-phosphate kinase/D-beta-D-heptose 1-phosphate adenosyltransferase